MSPMKNLLRKPLPFQYFYATLGIVALNLVFFFLYQVAPVSLPFMAMIPFSVLHEGTWWQVFTYMYVHANQWHLFFNMLALVLAGLSVERKMGSWEFLVFYHLVGLLAGVFSLVVYSFTAATIPLLGASGAIFGVLLAFAGLYPNARILIFFVVPIRAIYAILIWTAFEIFSEIFNPYSGVAHLTHLAGFLFAFLYLWIRFGLNVWSVFLHRDRYND